MRAAGTPDMADWPDAERKEFGMLVKRQKELYASAFERALRGKNVSH